MFEPGAPIAQWIFMMFNMFITFHQNRNNFVKFLHHVMNRWGSTRACTRKPFCMAWGIKTPQCHKSSAFCRRKQACWPGSSPNISESLIKSYASFCKSSKILQDLIESYEDAFWRHFGSFRFFPVPAAQQLSWMMRLSVNGSWPKLLETNHVAGDRSVSSCSAEPSTV